MTRLARAGNIGGLGDSGPAGCVAASSAKRFSSISDASAITPMPVPQLRKNCLRVMDLSQRSCVAVIVFVPSHAHGKANWLSWPPKSRPTQWLGRKLALFGQFLLRAALPLRSGAQ